MYENIASYVLLDTGLESWPRWYGEYTIQDHYFYRLLNTI